MRRFLRKTWVFPIAALLVQLVGLLCYRWSWIAAFGPTRTLPESWDIAAPMLILATLTGWSASMVISPVTATVAITSAELKQPASVVGLKWNGLFVLCFVALLFAIFAGWTLIL